MRPRRRWREPVYRVRVPHRTSVLRRSGPIKSKGRPADGALYALFKPVNWNGDVIYYAHGIIDPALAVTLPTGDDAEAIRDALGRQGFAIAYSSWSENGYDFKDGMQRTHQLAWVRQFTIWKTEAQLSARTIARRPDRRGARRDVSWPVRRCRRVVRRRWVVRSDRSTTSAKRARYSI